MRSKPAEGFFPGETRFHCEPPCDRGFGLEARVPRRKLSIAPDSILNRKSLVSSEEPSNFRRADNSERSALGRCPRVRQC